MKPSWYDRWKAFLRTKRHYPDTGTHTTAYGTATIRCASAAPKQSASALPRNLKRLMAEREMSVEVLAGKAHISASNIRHLLRGTGYERGTPEASPNPTLTTLLAVAEALGVGIEDLVEGREP